MSARGSEMSGLAVLSLNQNATDITVMGTIAPQSTALNRINYWPSLILGCPIMEAFLKNSTIN
jgi:hypothetical protein